MILQLFLAFCQIGLFSIGGGYASLPLIQAQVVETHAWLTMNEFADIVTISQMTPGPIAINAARFVGTRIAGLPGAIVATLGSVFPSFVIVIVFAVLYRRYHTLKLVQGVLGSLQPAVVGLIASAGVSIVNHALLAYYGSLDSIALAIMIGCLAVLRIFRINQIYVILGAGVVGGIAYSLFPR